MDFEIFNITLLVIYGFIEGWGINNWAVNSVEEAKIKLTIACGIRILVLIILLSQVFYNLFIKNFLDKKTNIYFIITVISFYLLPQLYNSMQFYQEGAIIETLEIIEVTNHNNSNFKNALLEVKNKDGFISDYYITQQQYNYLSALQNNVEIEIQRWGNEIISYKVILE
ncbi:MAG: hypothetical protein ATN36_03600 [Epulopiscium sp. Nele67-Bin005]|nr:MAG: hypothetical protein ATN36_03600 [Epulopiscium sp. Nele67-Bin005]